MGCGQQRILAGTAPTVTQNLTITLPGAPLTLHLLDTGQRILQCGQSPGAALAPALQGQPAGSRSAVMSSF